MNNSDQRLSHSLDELSSPIKEQERLNVLKKLNLLTPDTIPVWEEATQMVARFLEIPICFLGLMLRDHLVLKSALGLAKLGFMNPLAQDRKICRKDSFCAQVIDTEQSLIIEDTLANPRYSHLPLVKNYGIRSYLGIPLITTTGHCLGTLAVMDLVPHAFSLKEQEFLALTARWCLRELETQYYCKNITSNNSHYSLKLQPSFANLIDSCQIQMFKKLPEKVRAPLTNIIGMSSVLKNETYGSLNQKQKNYLEIIYQSGHRITSLIETLEKTNLQDEDFQIIKPSPTTPQMIAQEIITSLQNTLKLELLVEPDNNLYLVDNQKICVTIYYLSMSLLFNKNNQVRIKIDSLDKNNQILISVINNRENNHNFWLVQKQDLDLLSQDYKLKSSRLLKIIQETEPSQQFYTQLLELFLGCYLAELQEGEILLQGCQDLGYQYILKLPKILAK